MAGLSAPLPQADLIRRIRNVFAQTARGKRIDLTEFERALDDLGCPKPDIVGRILSLVDR